VWGQRRKEKEEGKEGERVTGERERGSWGGKGK